MKKAATKNTMGKAIFVMALFLISALGCKKSNEEINPGYSLLADDDISSSTNVTKASARLAHDWYKLQLSFLLERNSTLNNNAFPYFGIGLYESIRHGIKNSVSFSTKINQMPPMPDKEKNNGYHWPVSANAAMASMLRSFNIGLTAANNAAIDALEAKYNTELNPAENSASFKRSQAFGRKIAEAIYNWSLTDDYNASNVGYVPPVDPPGVFHHWRPTPLANVPVPVLPFLGNASTFVAVNTNVNVPSFPFTYSTDPLSDFYLMAKEVYDVNAALTQDQKNTALFWVDQGNGVGYTPNGHDISLVLQVLEQSGANLGLSAEAYAKAGIAQRDGSIVTFRSKYINNLIRPVSYIRGVIEPITEPATIPDWLPFIVTPPHPEYPAAHSGVTGSVMQAVAQVIGENVPVTDATYEFRGFPARTFSNLFAAAEEAGISRLYGGIHYTVSINAGLDLAKVVGNNVGNLSLRQ
jgi:PAP2 superfamily